MSTVPSRHSRGRFKHWFTKPNHTPICAFLWRDPLFGAPNGREPSRSSHLHLVWRRTMPGYLLVNKFDDTFSCHDTVQVCDRRTNTWTSFAYIFILKLAGWHRCTAVVLNMQKSDHILPSVKSAGSAHATSLNTLSQKTVGLPPVYVKVKVMSIGISPIRETSVRRTGVERSIKWYHRYPLTLRAMSRFYRFLDYQQHWHVTPQ